MKRVSIGLITGREAQHKYFATILSRTFDITFIVSRHSNMSDLEYLRNAITIDDERLLPILEKHVELRKKYAEEYLLPEGTAFPERPTYNITDGAELHTSDCLEFIATHKSEFLVLYGAPLVKNNILDLFSPRKILNIHMGLAEHYRGSVANLMAFFKRDYARAGMTVHLLNKRIDGGEMIRTVVADYVRGDDPQRVAIRLVKKGPLAVKDAILELATKPGEYACGNGVQNNSREFKISYLKQIYSDFEDEMPLKDLP